MACYITWHCTALCTPVVNSPHLATHTGIFRLIRVNALIKITLVITLYDYSLMPEF